MNSKILIIGSIPPPYHGVNVVNQMILDSKLAETFNIVHLDISDPRSLKNLGKLDFRNIWLAIKHVFISIKLLYEERPAIVYLPICQTIIGFLRDAIFIALSKLFGARVIIHLHGSYFRTLYEGSNLLVKLVIRHSCKLVDKAIVLGKSLRYIFEGLVPNERIAVVPNGIDDTFVDHFNDNIRGGDTYFKILYLSSLLKSKGYIDVIHVLPEVLKFNKFVKFIFAGELRCNQNEKNYISKFVDNNNLVSNIDYTGVASGNKKKKLFLSSDIFVLPSHIDGQPLAILEAMAAGLPIITTDTGAIKEMVVNAENGFIVGMQNPKQIAQKVIKLLKNNYLRKQMGEKSRERFLKYYTKDKFIDKLSHVFESVLIENITNRRKR